MPTVDLDSGRIHYEEAGPRGGRPVVCVHGYLMGGSLFADLARRLAAEGIRCITPTWPLGAHTEAMRPGADVTPPLVGVYLGTTYAGAWLDRVADARLGERSTGWLRVLPTGVLIRRPGYDDLFLPSGALGAARTDAAHAGRVIGAGGLIVVEWHHGGIALETGFRGDDRSRHAAIAEAINAMIPPELPAIDLSESIQSVKESS